MVEGRPLEEMHQLAWLEQIKALGQVVKNYPYTVHPFGRGNLTTAGVQYGAVTSGGVGITTASSNMKVVGASTINWPGLTGHAIDEIELGLSADLKASTSLTTTVGYIWEGRNTTGTTGTWVTLSTMRLMKSTAYANRTLSGYFAPAAGFSKLPFAIRLRFYNKTTAQGRARVKNSSYVSVKAKRTT